VRLITRNGHDFADQFPLVVAAVGTLWRGAGWDGEIVYQQACKLGFEGIVSKGLGSPYRSGRSKHWLKIKNPRDYSAVSRRPDSCR
jgi:ATP-dependent DNA ligase